MYSLEAMEAEGGHPIFSFNFPNSKLQVGVVGLYKRYVHVWAYAALRAVVDNMHMAALFVRRPRQTAKRHIIRIRRSRRLGVSTCNTTKAVILFAVAIEPVPVPNAYFLK